jgi:hypothetical protein
MTSFEKPQPEPSEQLRDSSADRPLLKKISLEELRRKYANMMCPRPTC